MARVRVDEHGYITEIADNGEVALKKYLAVGRHKVMLPPGEYECDIDHDNELLVVKSPLKLEMIHDEDHEKRKSFVWMGNHWVIKGLP